MIFAHHAFATVMIQAVLAIFLPFSPCAAQDVTGAELYEASCAMCHIDGTANAPNPALVGSPIVNGPPEGVVRIILRGQSGQSLIDGKPGGGIMPAQATLSDQEIAEIVTYVRATFGDKEEAAGVSPEFVAKIRAEEDGIRR
jgi:mono/diheme cytochrome c family protein